MRLLLDTVVFIWAVGSPQRLSRKAMLALQHTEAIREMSALSISEMAIKQAKGQFIFREKDILLGIADLQLRVLPYTAAHAYHLFGLPVHHADPFDRQIIAQALAESIPIVTCDEKFRLYTGLEVIW